MPLRPGGDCRSIHFNPVLLVELKSYLEVFGQVATLDSVNVELVVDPVEKCRLLDSRPRLQLLLFLLADVILAHVVVDVISLCVDHSRNVFACVDHKISRYPYWLPSSCSVSLHVHVLVLNKLKLTKLKRTYF